MKITEKKGAMLGIMAIIIVASTMTSGIMQMNRLTRKVDNVFVIGEKGDGLSIARDLSTRITRSKNMLRIAKEYISENDTDIQDIQNAMTTLSEEEDKHALYVANQKIQTSMDSLYARLQEMNIDEMNQQALKEEKSVFDNAMNTIENDAYNSLVSEYEKKIDTIPGKIFAQFTDKVEYFK